MADGRGFRNFLQNIDRRIIYAILFIILAWTTYKPLRLSMTPTENPKRLYAAVEACPDDKVIFIMGFWGYGTQGENWPQFESLVYHCLKSGKKFAFMGADALSIHLYNQIVEDMSAKVYEESEGKKDARYGVDWINFGFKAPPTALGAVTAYYVGFADDIRGFVGKDYRDKEIASYPIMRDIRRADDFYMIFEISAGLDGIYNWIGVIKPRHPRPLYGGAVTAIVAPNAYPYVNSGQLVSLIDGYRGAAEYEILVEHEGRGYRMSTAQSFGHLLIFFLLILGNIGYFATRKR